MNRPRHRVSVKIAFVNEQGDKVLMTRLHDGGFGLPGGHIEGVETPEQALRRELQEELGLMYEDTLTKIDFWRDVRTERILLGFTAVLKETAILTANSDEMVGVYWASLADFDNKTVTTVTYEPFIRQILGKSR